MNLLPSAKPSASMDESLLSMGESLSELDTPEDASQPSSHSECKKAVNLGRICSTDTTHVQTTPADLIEYEWPPKSGDRYFVQEQIADLLDVKSFKRKYPNIPRHSIEGGERSLLFKELNADEVIPQHLQSNLTAVDLDSVLSMMAVEYQDIYTEYQKVCTDRRQKQLMAKHDEMRMEEQAPPSPLPPSTPKSTRVGSRRSERNPPRACNVCQLSSEGEAPLDKLLKCTQCLSYIHARCAEMSVEMYRVVKGYNWSCIDCKICTVCSKPDSEADMMCCDLCDRGYHTFCVGLSAPPNGNWHCSIYCKGKHK